MLEQAEKKLQEGSSVFNDQRLCREDWVPLGICRIRNLKCAVTQGAADIQLIKATEIREALPEGFPEGWCPFALVAQDSRKYWLERGRLIRPIQMPNPPG